MPQETTGFLEEALHGTAARSTIQPDSHLIHRLPNGRLVNEKQRPGAIAHVNRHEAGIHLSNIERYIRQVVNQVLWTNCQRSKLVEECDTTHSRSSCSRIENLFRIAHASFEQPPLPAWRSPAEHERALQNGHAWMRRRSPNPPQGLRDQRSKQISIAF